MGQIYVELGPRNLEGGPYLLQRKTQFYGGIAWDQIRMSAKVMIMI